MQNRRTESPEGYMEWEQIVLGTLRVILTLSGNILRYLRF
jgi:hypothetical protein